MRLLHTLCALLFFINSACAEEFSIEEESLTAVPKAVANTISAQKKFEFPECSFKGKLAHIADSDKPSDYIVTTAQACGWGAAAGPIWIVAKINGSYKVVLQTTAYATEIRKDKDHGLHQLVTTSGTAGHASYTRWAFTGKNYKPQENYVFLPDDEKLCNAHKDICPF